MKIILSLCLLFSIGNPVGQDKKETTGIASYYHSKFEGRKTASGEVFSNKEMTAAHKTLPFETMVRITNLKNNKEVIVRINDRLPANSKRMIDLSQAAASELEMIRSGIIKVKIEIVESNNEEVW